MGWLDEHMTDFVETYTWSFEKSSLGYFKPEELTVIKNCWRSIKKEAKGRPILLPGRDVFIFEVLARRENYETLFMPECSRQTVTRVAHDLGEKVNDYFLFDTGFAGSIPRALRTNNFRMFSAHMGINNKQVFPRLSFSRGLALKIENSPKYWFSGRLDEYGSIIQERSEPYQFQQAARLTIEIYTNSAAKFVNKHKPISTREGW